MEYFERFIAEHPLADVFMVSPEKKSDYLDFDPLRVAAPFVASNSSDWQPVNSPQPQFQLNWDPTPGAIE